jgi:hypothetical protein
MKTKMLLNIRFLRSDRGFPFHRTVCKWAGQEAPLRKVLELIGK